MISWPVARATFRERSRSGLTIAIAVMLVLVSLRSSPEQVFAGFPGEALLVVFTLLLGAGLLSDEIESGHAQLVLLRPLTRAAWYGGRFAGAAALLCSGIAISFGVSAISTAVRGELAPMQLLVLPAACIWAAGWLSIVAAVGAVVRSWTNAGAVIVAAIAWGSIAGLLQLANPKWAAVWQAAGTYLGPQQPLPLAHWEPVAFDLLWLFGAWLLGVLLINRRELARRRT